VIAIVTALVMLAQGAPANDSAVVIAAGTQIRAQLEQSIATRTLAANDDIVMRVSHKLLVGSKVALPAGTMLVARIDTIAHAALSRHHLDLRMHLVRVIFADGDSVPFAQPVLGTSSDAAWLHVEYAHGVGKGIAVAAPVIGTAVGAAKNGARGAVVGGAVGVAVGLFVDLVGAIRGHGLVAEKGAPIDLVLGAPLVFDRARLMAAEEFAASRPVFEPAARPKRCLAAGTPGSPDVTIPGVPPSISADGTLETPGTPTIVLPGTPATPDSWVPC
jgi:hypothetical protein